MRPKTRSQKSIFLKSLAISTASFALLTACAQEESLQIAKASENSSTSTLDAKNAPATAQDAQAFVDHVEKTYAEIGEEAARISWMKETNITFDSNWLEAKMGARLTKLSVDFANETKKFEGLNLPSVLQRKINRIRGGIVIPAPSSDGAAEELSQINSRLSTTYSTGKIEFNGTTVPQDETELLMRTLRDPETLKEVWGKWRENAKAMKSDYTRMVEISNEGARELGFNDTGHMWRSAYDMDADEFGIEVDRLWGQVKPLYDELHCYTRAQLNRQYGDDAVPLDGPIRADLLGNMWAQSWSALADVVIPKTSGKSVNTDQLLLNAGYSEKKMVEAGEGFFTSLGLEALPETFWERSQIVKPEGREVVCHASAWDLDAKDDIRIKMCTKVNGEDFQTVHHELGHNFYQRAYKNQSTLHQDGAHDGFHEAIGDMIGLSITPRYLQQIGLLNEKDIPDASGDIALLLDQALGKIAFLPFGLMVDKWRWQVFSGELTPATYNEGWWNLRKQYQGIVPPLERSADAFDPGSKYHVPNNVPYMRYFLAHILQFQFYKAACDQIGWTGPLHRCSFYGSKEVGKKFNAMLELGASKPWPDALEAFTGTREMNGSAVLEYFAPLMTFLREENQGQQCGWQ